MNFNFSVIFLIMYHFTGKITSTQQKLDVDVLLNNYSEFLNSGDKKLQKIKDSNSLENAIIKSKLDVLGGLLKQNVDFIRKFQELDVVFLVDASSSVGYDNFKSELRFVKKILSDVTVDYNHTRVSVITFSSPSNTIVNINAISSPEKENNKCLLLNNQLMNIEYKGGETYTFGAFEKAKEIFETSNRNESKKVLFLITDGYSNGFDPIPISTELKNSQVTIFTIGIRNGNYKELYDLSSSPGQLYSYLLDSFEEFEGLARRALHMDLRAGNYIPLGLSTPCDKLCDSGNCCDEHALCSCGTTTGHYSCICQPGYYGNGLRNNCLPCKPGMYTDGHDTCLPCPDIHHTTNIPAFGIDSCVCKRGFQSDNKGGCKILKCPKISAPEHGYIVKKKECSNVLNSACGIRCEVGYTLVGSSIRLCQENATWSGSDPSCEVKTCTRPPIPKYGSLKCEHSDIGTVYDKTEKYFPVDTVCNFTCAKGNTLIGSSQRTCLPIAQWDGLRTICKPIKCNKLPQTKFGKIEPASCTTGKQEFGKKCRIICNKGFKADGEIEKICGDSDLWNGKHTVCFDKEPPNLTCPKNITTKNIPGTSFGKANWSAPNVTDNSGLNISVWIYPAISNITDYKFSIGITPVTYFAQDLFQNAIKCTFFVEVIDEEPPVIEGCISPPTFLINSRIGENITWDEPYIFDNSKNFTVNKTHDFGTFKIGTTLVTYTAKDFSGNINICNINITVEESYCVDLPSPSNGQSNCTDISSGMRCLITCQDGYAVPLHAPIATDMSENGTSFICSHGDTSWYNQPISDGFIFPECSITTVPDVVEQEGDINIPLDNFTCNDTNKIEEIENNIKENFENEICTGNCKTNLTSDCLDEQLEEETNAIVKKRRRSIPPEETKGNMNSTNEVLHKNIRMNRRNKKRLNVKFQLRGKLKISTKQINVTSSHINGTITVRKTIFTCPVGFIPRKNRCVQCPRGAFHNGTSNICQSCDFGYYNDKLGQTNCTSCPVNYSTSKMRAKNFKDCKEMCSPGTHARRKKIRVNVQQIKYTIERPTLRPYCRSCPIGTYQPDYGTIRCIPCPNGYTTIRVGSTRIEDCIPTADEICSSRPNLCRNGTCNATNEYQFTCDCFQHFYGINCEHFLSPCNSDPCINGGTCIAFENDFKCMCTNGYQGKYCEEVQEKESYCKINCQNGGTCINIEDEEFVCVCPKGFSGETCQNFLRNCDNVICENNSTCHESQDTFKCICSQGYLGHRCNLLPCDYRPCDVNSICINIETKNTMKTDYKCICPEGYTGDRCLEQINYCINSPCLNDATCINTEGSYKCLCSKLYYGQECQFKRDTKYMLNFARYDINNFIGVTGFEENLFQITACLWIQTTDSVNYGTLLSYATRSSDNVFTLTDYTGLVLYVNKEYIVTDVLLNDGYWHHICAAWQSVNGEYQIFVDGSLINSGRNLASGSKIEGNGYLVIGQEQDDIGGKFSQSQTFVGNMAYIDIWSRKLNETEILTHLNDCSDSILGDLYAWPEIQEHIKGNVQRLNSSFCQKCKEPHIMYNGLINIIDNTAFYSCNEGYELSNKKFENGRKCMKTSKWEELDDPYCRIKYCGYPGFVKNAFFIGNDFFYNSKVIFQCYSGYQMVGSMSITCRADGTWYPEKPQCVAPQCTLPTIEHGFIRIITDDLIEDVKNVKANVEMETEIRIICFDNATLVGPSTLICLENGTWSDTSAKCILNKQELPVIAKPKKSALSCSESLIPPAPENGYIFEESQNLVRKGSRDYVEYKCRPGYKLVGVNVSTCIIDGYWTEPNITCQAIICPEVPTFKNMVLKSSDISVTVYQAGNMLTYECPEGYKMFGTGIIRCTILGRWSKMQSRCSKKSCGKPQASFNAEVQGDSYLFGDTVKIICPTGKTYDLSCGKDGSWIGALEDATC
ncbi:sushi, von Willebrand factor type A, EGF and pentraxin domain-containing protein 1-like [Sitophilus oryzae]|uniref:Sushi, von Willebrand factor type A, EGF and pentraxin domain-containing protein 1-like n=1 Tax=Sitophilus oryzae TaxID=7048 RepID=A0A6J2YV58_SITOR|nr:sushi, von Willebrand factor type A, EGF and pentraxin domain-containing protein 1-like [Sitophilus oryzae]